MVHIHKTHTNVKKKKKNFSRNRELYMFYKYSMCKKTKKCSRRAMWAAVAAHARMHIRTHTPTQNNPNKHYIKIHIVLRSRSRYVYLDNIHVYEIKKQKKKSCTKHIQLHEIILAVLLFKIAILKCFFFFNLYNIKCE